MDAIVEQFVVETLESGTPTQHFSQVVVEAIVFNNPSVEVDDVVVEAILLESSSNNLRHLSIDKRLNYSNPVRFYGEEHPLAIFLNE